MNKTSKTLKKLSDELKEEKWILNENNRLEIPLNNNYSFFIEKEEDKYLVGWLNVSDIENKYIIGEVYKHKSFLNIGIEKRNFHIRKIAKENNISRKKEDISDFLNDTINKLNKHSIKDIIDYNYNKILELSEIENSEDNFKYKYECFEDYPEDIQYEAKKIIKSNKFLYELLDSVSWKHEGDKKTTMLLLLSCASIYINEPIHQILNAQKGKGKTDVFNRIKDLQPDKYIVDLVSFSVKSLYYGKNQILNNKYNILVIDDAKFTNDIVELLKLILDNERKKKIHRTVIDGKYKEMELEGYFLGLINRAKDYLDMELADRCYLNSLENNNETNIKNKIKEKSFRNVDLLYEKNNLILKASYQYLIEKEIKIFNPFLLFIDVNKHGNRNINHYFGFIKSMSFYNYSMRKTIDNVTIGSFKDVESVLTIVSKDFLVQNDKLTDLEKLIIDELDKNPENNTNKKLGKVLGYSKERIGQIIKGRDNQMGLEAKDYIEVKIEDKGQYMQNEYKLLKNYKESYDSNITHQTLQNFISLRYKSPLLVKTSIITSFLEYKHILINKYMGKKITTFLKNNDIEPDSYNNLCNLIDSFYKYIKEDENIIYIDSANNISKKQLSYHYNFVNDINKEIFSLLSEKSLNNFVSEKPQEMVQIEI